ncbi:MAG: TfoX/Sxy family protein [Verrucomicrobiota bacterium]
MTSDQAFAEHVIELMGDFGEVSAKRMFGGHGIFREGLMFALIADGQLYLKVDPENQVEFERRDLEPFTYQRKDREMQLSYFSCPDEAFQSSGAMWPWADRGWSAALRADLAKPKSRRKHVAP